MDTERDSVVTMSEDDLLTSAEKYLDPDLKFIRRYAVKKPLGFALLIGSDRSDHSSTKPAPLRCVYTDLKMMERALTDRQWFVENPCAKHGYGKVPLRYDQYVSIMKKVSSQDLHKFSCFLYYYTGHGTPKGIVFSGGDYVAYNNVVEEVCSWSSLQGKPKIFIFDTCRDLPATLDPDFEVKGFSDEKPEDEVVVKTRPDTVICFSASEGEASYSTGRGGSIFTIQLTQALRNLSNRLPFGEIMTQVRAGTICMSSLHLGKQQQPVYSNGLNYQLLLTTENVSPGTPVVKHVDRSYISSYIQVPLSPSDHSLERKGPEMIDRRATARRPSSPVMADSGKNRRPPRTFSTRKEIEEHLDELGEGVSVFICYAPDSHSPYTDPQERQSHIQQNERLVTLLAHDLACHGFQVMTDLHMRDDEPRSWVRWYINRIRLCDHVILVCSPAFNELFTQEKLQSAPKGLRAQHIRLYSNVIYDEYTKDVIRGTDHSKFIPVILDRAYTYQRDTCVPSLLCGSSVYELFETAPRQFDYSKKDGDFEKLVCRMAGINRAEIERPSGQDFRIHDVRMLNQGVPIQSSTYQDRRYIEAMSQPRPGYKTIASSVGSSVPQPQSSSVPQWGDQSQWPAPMNLTAGAYQTPGQPQPQGLPMVPHQVAPTPQFFPSTVAPPTLPQPVPSTTAAPPPDPSTLPNRPLNQRIAVWLSRRIVKWKFFARRLELPEYEIQRITDENPGDIGEQCYQMFHTWYQRAPGDYNYQMIGKVLLDDERNKNLYHEFVKEVLAVET